MIRNDNARRRGNGGRAADDLQTWPGCSSENSPGPTGAQAETVSPRQYPKRWMLAAVRRRQIFRLVDHRRAAGVPIPVRGTMIAASDCLADLEGWPVPPHGNPHLGLHPVPVRQMVRDLRFTVDEDLISEAIEIIAELRARGGNLSSDEAGRLLALTRPERDACRAWLFDAAEEPREARRLRKEAEKRERDRQRLRAKRDLDRAAAGKLPIDRTRPQRPARKEWEMLNLSRPTYFRLKKAGRLPSVADDTETPASPTYAGNSETPASPTIDTPVCDAKVSRAGEVEAGGGFADRHLDTVAHLETRLLHLLGEGSIKRGRVVAETLGPISVGLWAYLNDWGQISDRNRQQTETLLHEARAKADQVRSRRDAA